MIVDAIVNKDKIQEKLVGHKTSEAKNFEITIDFF